jgi:hypothetical protein
MPRIEIAKFTPNRRAPPDIGLMREIIIISTTVERPDGDVSTIVLRPGVVRVHAQIRPLKESQIINYQAVFGTQLKPPTHEAIIRYPRDIAIGINHWVYHQDKHIGVDTWYKVRTTEDLAGVHRFLVLQMTADTIRDSRQDPATQQAPPQWSTPEQDASVADRLTYG